MIPKILHYVYMTDKIPDKIQGYMSHWKRLMPTYQVIHWHGGNFDIQSVKWVKQAAEAKKWAFVADYIRLWALYTHGGIYLDSDVEVLKPFDALLELPYFIGKEKTKDGIECGILGSEPTCRWIKDCLDYYTDKDFILPNGKYTMIPMPHILKNILGNQYGFSTINSIREFDKNSAKIQIFTEDFFSPKYYGKKIWRDGKIDLTENTYTIHHFNASWKPWYSKAKRFISNLMVNFKHECTN